MQVGLGNRGDISDNLGINLAKTKDSNLELFQTHMIGNIIAEVGVGRIRRINPTPSAFTRILNQYIKAAACDCLFNYQTVVGIINYLEQGSRLDMEYAVHQGTMFCSNPQQSHADSIIHLCTYLQRTQDQGIIIYPKKDLQLEAYANADFIGNHNKRIASFDTSIAKSFSGFVIMFCACSFICTSKVKMYIPLFSFESESHSLSQAFRETIPVMEILKEINNNVF